MRTWTAARVGATLLSLLLLVGIADARAQNIVQNPGFTGGLSGCTVEPSPSYTVGWDGMEGNSAPGSATINLPSSPAGGTTALFLRQCVPATGSTAYDVGGSFRYPSSATAKPIGSVFVTFYSDSAAPHSSVGASRSR